PPQDVEVLGQLPHLRTERLGPGIGRFHFGRRLPFGGDPCLPQHELQRQLLPTARRGVRERLQQCQTAGEVVDRLLIRIPPQGVRGGLLPIPHRPSRVPPPLTVHGQLRPPPPRPPP